ncbi:hypothetical protein Tco_0768467 [Tanacetum coccineum]
MEWISLTHGQYPGGSIDLDEDLYGVPVEPNSIFDGMGWLLMFLTAIRTRPCIRCLRDEDLAGCQDSRKKFVGIAQFLGDRLLNDYGFDFNKKFLCIVITKVLLLFAATTSSTLALNTLTYGTTSSESKWKIEW